MTNPADWPIEEPPEDIPDPNDTEHADEIKEIIAKNAPIAQDGSATQQVVYVAPDIANEDKPEFRDTGVVTTGSEPQTHLDTQ